MTPRRMPRILLAPGSRPGRPRDLATRAALIAHQRHAARRRRRARRSLRSLSRGLVVGLALGAIGVASVVAAHWLKRTPLLAVTTVEVQGLRRLTAADVRAAAGIEPDGSILTVDVRAVEASLERLPGVRRARAVRHLPHRVTLMVEEREPYALVNGEGAAGLRAAEGLYWIDAEGYLIGPEPRPGVVALPILSGVSRTGAGGEGASSVDALRTGLALLRVVQRTGGRVAGRVSEIDLTAADGPVLYLTDGAEVRVGADLWGERLARLDGVLGDLDSRGERMASVDLRFRDLVVLTPRGVAASGPEARRRASQP